MATLVLPLRCANSSGENGHCEEVGKNKCGNCRLVVYCSKDCQKGHWSTHKTTCKGPLSKESWQPAWVRERRAPFTVETVAPRHAQNPFGGTLYLWGNTPAVDVLHLSQNEGAEYESDISLLFAASGDLRNVVQTIATLPNTLTQRIELTINDWEFRIVARNTIILLFALSHLDKDDEATPANNAEIAESLIHLWYSASIPEAVQSSLIDIVRPLISYVCDKIRDRPWDNTFVKTWKFKSGRSLRLFASRSQWDKLEQWCDVPTGLTETKASGIRRATTLAPERTDFRDRWYYKEATPFARVSKHKFREDGLLLPFGHPRDDFSVPNPTLLQGSEVWLMGDQRNPLDGWPILEVCRQPHMADEDIYGKLFVYLRLKLETFLERLLQQPVCFEMLCFDAMELPRHLAHDRYTRIEVSNITDAGYVGIRETLPKLGPLLQPPEVNPHATIITIFINAVMEIAQTKGQVKSLPDFKAVSGYLPAMNIMSMMNPDNADVMRLWDSRTQIMDVERYFQEYMMRFEFDRASAASSMKMKEKNSVVEPWPTCPKLKLEQKGAVEEFRILLGSGFTNTERYTEWRGID